MSRLFALKDEISFWSTQLYEHCLLLHAGLGDESFKREAKDLSDDWTDAPATAKAVIPRLDRLDAFLDGLLAAADGGRWLGWIYPALVKHMKLENDYFRYKLTEPEVDVRREIDFWSKEFDDRLALTDKLLDPKETQESANIAKLRLMLSESRAANAQRTFDTINRYFDIAGMEMKEGNIASVVPPMLAAHDAREGERGFKTFEALAARKSL